MDASQSLDPTRSVSRRRRTLYAVIALASVFAVAAVVLDAYWVDEVEVCHIDGVNWEPNNFGQIPEPPGCSGTGFQGIPYTAGGNYPYGSLIHEAFELQNNGSRPCYVSNLTVSFSAPPITGASSNLPMVVPAGGQAQLEASFPAPSMAYDWSIVISYNAWPGGSVTS